MAPVYTRWIHLTHELSAVLVTKDKCAQPSSSQAPTRPGPHRAVALVQVLHEGGMPRGQQQPGEGRHPHRVVPQPDDTRTLRQGTAAAAGGNCPYAADDAWAHKSWDCKPGGGWCCRNASIPPPTPQVAACPGAYLLGCHAGNVFRPLLEQGVEHELVGEDPVALRHLVTRQARAPLLQQLVGGKGRAARGKKGGAAAR